MSRRWRNSIIRPIEEPKQSTFQDRVSGAEVELHEICRKYNLSLVVTIVPEMLNDQTIQAKSVLHWIESR